MSALKQLMVASLAMDSMALVDHADSEVSAFEYAEATSDMDMAVLAMEQMTQVHANLESIAAGAAASLDNGGLDATAAAILSDAVAMQLDQLGVVPTEFQMDDYATAAGRMTATSVQLDGIGEWVSNIWESIKKFAKKVMKAISDFWIKHISSLGRLHKAILALEKTLNDATKDTPDDSVTVKGSSLRYISKLGKFDKGTLISGLDDMSTLLVTADGKEMFVTATKELTKVAKDLADNIDKAVSTSDSKLLSGASDAVDTLVEELVKNTAAVFSVPGTKDESIDGQVSTAYTSEFLGDKSIELKVTTSTGAKVKLKSVKVGMVTMKGQKAVDYDAAETELNLSKNDAEAILTSLKKLSTRAVKVKLDPAKAGKESDNLTKAGDKLASAINKSVTKDTSAENVALAKEAAGGVITAIGVMNANLLEPTLTVSRYSSQVMSYTYSLLNKSAKNLK